MNNKDVQVLKEIQAHIVSVLKYCERCKETVSIPFSSFAIQ